MKVVNLQWFYRLGLLLFPDDWHLARAFGMAVTLALYAACMLFFVKCAKLGRPGLWMVGTLLWPFGQHYLVYAIYGGYYLVYTFFYMLVLALVLRSLDADKKHCALQWLAACFVTAIAGMNGVKQLMVFHAPLCIAAAVLLVLALHDSGTSDWKTALQHCRRQVRLFAASLVTAVAGAAGYFISNSVMSRLYDFKSYSFIVWDRDENWFTLDRILMDFFHEFGYQNGSGIFHFGGIAAGIGLLLCLLVGWHQQTRWLLWYPVIVNAFGFVLFCSSLWQPMTLVERIARWREPQLPAAAVAYTRRVTQVWCLFFVANGAGAGWTIWHGDMALWSLYNGVISYLLMASLMTAEYLLRRRMRARIALGGGGCR